MWVTFPILRTLREHQTIWLLCSPSLPCLDRTAHGDALGNDEQDMSGASLTRTLSFDHLPVREWTILHTHLVWIPLRAMFQLPS